MANLSSLFGGQVFKPAEVEAVNTDFSPIPKGDYRVKITESEIAATKSNNGTMLTLKLVVQDGKFANRILFENLCVSHTNATAQAIAQTRLKQICESLKVAQLKDSSQLHDKPLMVRVDVELDKYQTERSGSEQFRNAIKGYAPVPKAAPAEAEAMADDELSEDVPW